MGTIAGTAGPPRSAWTTDRKQTFQAWRTLAPAGPDLRDRQEELVDVCERLLNRSGDPDHVWAVWATVMAALSWEELLKSVDIPTLKKRNAAILRRGQNIRRQLDKWLQAAIAHHAEAASHKAYDRCLDHNGLIAGPARRPWHRFPTVYRRLLRVVNADPALRLPPIVVRRGNPKKARNARLRAELTTLGVSKAVIDHILSALLFTSSSPSSRRTQQR